MCTPRHTVTASVYDRKGRLIATAQNNYSRSHPVQAHFAKLAGLPYKVYLHAEIAALLKCGDKIPYKIKVERFHKDGSAAMAAPCSICLLAIKAWKVKYIEHTVG